MKKMPPAASVDDYLNALPEKTKLTLEKVRKAIRSAVPAVEEVISYRMPTFKFNGPVAAFAAFESHCSYYTMSYGVIKAFSNELKSYDTSGVTIRFLPGKPLPAALVKKLVMAKLKENEKRIAAKKKK